MITLHPSSQCDCCKEAYTVNTTPWSLPCGHTYCFQCIPRMVTQISEGTQNRPRAHCPLCRKPFYPDKAKKLHVSLFVAPEPTVGIQDILDARGEADVKEVLLLADEWLEANPDEVPRMSVQVALSILRGHFDHLSIEAHLPDITPTQLNTSTCLRGESSSSRRFHLQNPSDEGPPPQGASDSRRLDESTRTRPQNRRSTPRHNSPIRTASPITDTTDTAFLIQRLADLLGTNAHVEPVSPDASLTTDVDTWATITSPGSVSSLFTSSASSDVSMSSNGTFADISLVGLPVGVPGSSLLLGEVPGLRESPPSTQPVVRFAETTAIPPSWAMASDLTPPPQYPGTPSYPAPESNRHLQPSSRSLARRSEPHIASLYAEDAARSSISAAAPAVPDSPPYIPPLPAQSRRSSAVPIPNLRRYDELGPRRVQTAAHDLRPSYQSTHRHSVAGYPVAPTRPVESTATTPQYNTIGVSTHRPEAHGTPFNVYATRKITPSTAYAPSAAAPYAIPGYVPYRPLYRPIHGSHIQRTLSG